MITGQSWSKRTNSGSHVPDNSYLDDEADGMTRVVRPWYEDDFVQATPDHEPITHKSWYDAEATRPYSYSENYVVPRQQITQQTYRPARRSNSALILLAFVAVLAVGIFFAANTFAAQRDASNSFNISPMSVKLLAPPAAVQPVQLSQAQVAPPTIAPAPAASGDNTVAQPEAPQGTNFVTLKEVVGRDAPSLQGAPISDWLTGSALQATGIWARGSDGIVWWEMRDPAGARAWAPGMDLISR